jgi:signal transduction histidine kinase
VKERPQAEEKPRRLRKSDVAFFAFFALILGFTMVVLAMGVVAALASVSPALHQQLHTVGFADDDLVSRSALAMAAASHQTLPPIEIALDYGFSLFNMGLALFLLRLRPRHRSARLLAVGMVGTAGLFNLQAHTVYEVMHSGLVEAALHYAYQFTTGAAYFFALLTFPDGRLSPGWSRPRLAVLYGLPTVAVAWLAYSLQTSHRTSVIIFFGLLAPLAGVLGQAYRYRRSTREATRQQSRLLFWALIPALALGLVAAAQGLADLLVPQLQGRALHEVPVATFRVFQPVFTIIPIALFIGILRYRLWEVDRVISRALAYGAMAAFVSALYIGVVIGIGGLIGSRGGTVTLSIVATGIAAFAFGPLKDRFQRLSNRLVYGRRSTPYEVLSELSERLTEAVETDELLQQMAQVLASGTAATGAQVWLRVGDELRLTAAWPPLNDATRPAQLPMTGESLPEFEGGTTAAPVRHHGELLGALLVARPAGEELRSGELKLVNDLASQAGLVLRNYRLTAELMARLEDVRLSRQRIVAAADEARRRLERDIHDGAQQQLVAMLVQLNLAQMVAARESPKVEEMLTQIKGNADEALQTLRDLARGIYPPLLASNGLAAALKAQAGKVPLPVAVDVVGVGRYDQDTEAAVYFCCLEALQNIAKSAQATSADVRLWTEDGRLNLSVVDDGIGFDVERGARGSGLQNMVDRMEALSGSLKIVSSPGKGTSVTGSVPVVHEAVTQSA